MTSAPTVHWSNAEWTESGRWRDGLHPCSVIGAQSRISISNSTLTPIADSTPTTLSFSMGIVPIAIPRRRAHTAAAMLRFSANLSFLFNEVPFLERFGEAAHAGFRAVEFAFGYDYQVREIAARVAEHKLDVVLINAPPGNYEAGDRGLASLSGREHEFAASVVTALRYAQALRCPRIHVMAGLLPEGADDRGARATAAHVQAQPALRVPGSRRAERDDPDRAAQPARQPALPTLHAGRGARHPRGDRHGQPQGADGPVPRASHGGRPRHQDSPLDAAHRPLPDRRRAGPQRAQHRRGQLRVSCSSSSTSSSTTAGSAASTGRRSPPRRAWAGSTSSSIAGRRPPRLPASPGSRRCARGRRARLGTARAPAPARRAWRPCRPGDRAPPPERGGSRPRT